MYSANYSKYTNISNKSQQSQTNNYANQISQGPPNQNITIQLKHHYEPTVNYPKSPQAGTLHITYITRPLPKTHTCCRNPFQNREEKPLKYTIQNTQISKLISEYHNPNP
jgi:hypothetical protein